MKKNKSTEYVLGIAATNRAVHAVLLEDSIDGPVVIRRFTRQRARNNGIGKPSLHPGTSDPNTDGFGKSTDYTVQFNDGGNAGNNLFLSSEFGGLDNGDADDAGGSGGVVSTFEMELGDLVSECVDAGYEDPRVTFSLSASDMTYNELHLPTGEKTKRISHEYLIELLTTQYKGVFDEERVAFFPMTIDEEGGERYLAVFPKATDSVTATLNAMRLQNLPLPAAQLVDAEVPALVGLARIGLRQFQEDPEAALISEDSGAPFAFAPLSEQASPKPPTDMPLNVLVVRAGFEDTLVLFMVGETIQHCESLRSLTAFDAPETVCSRVLLQQDEHGVGDVHYVLLLSEEREQELIETFEMFFPDARVESIRSQLPKMGDGVAGGATAAVAATASALRLLEDPYYTVAFEEINFLPKKLIKRQVKLPISWSFVSAAVLVVLTLLFFVTSYTKAEVEINKYQIVLQNYTPERTSSDINTLQASIDSMQNLHATYTRALEVLDTLLVGSDLWSRILEKTSQEAVAVSGFWIESFMIQNNELQLTGNATTRERIVAFAERTEGSITKLTFSEVREWPVYDFSINIRVDEELPEAAKYLREQVNIVSGSDVAGFTSSNVQLNN